jgi:glutathione peroxidase
MLATAKSFVPHAWTARGIIAFVVMLAFVVLVPVRAFAGYTFANIDGGQIDLDDYRGHPVLVVNTASLCGFTGQYDDLQTLHEAYGARGLLVLAVPSDDFAQELADDAAVKAYCAVNFDLTLPMTVITPVTGAAAHPFYAMLRQTYGFAPTWNFNKVLLGPDGQMIESWGAGIPPTAPAVVEAVEALLN